MAGNQISENILTRGNMNISALTRGFILPKFKYVIRRRGGGSSPEGYGYPALEKDLIKIKQQGDEVDYIQIFIKWEDKKYKYGKNIYARLITKKIEAILIESTKEKYKITVELIDKNEKEVI